MPIYGYQAKIADFDLAKRARLIRLKRLLFTKDLYDTINKEDAANNYARGHYTIGKAFRILSVPELTQQMFYVKKMIQMQTRLNVVKRLRIDKTNWAANGRARFMAVPYFVIRKSILKGHFGKIYGRTAWKAPVFDIPSLSPRVYWHKEA